MGVKELPPSVLTSTKPMSKPSSKSWLVTKLSVAPPGAMGKFVFMVKLEFCNAVSGT